MLPFFMDEDGANIIIFDGAEGIIFTVEGVIIYDGLDVIIFDGKDVTAPWEMITPYRTLLSHAAPC
jgi:hypothetical protein